MRGELDFFGIYIPGLLTCGLAAFLLNMVLRRALEHAGFYRLVWHRALFDLSMFVVVLGGVVWLTSAVGWQ